MDSTMGVAQGGRGSGAPAGTEQGGRGSGTPAGTEQGGRGSGTPAGTQQGGRGSIRAGTTGLNDSRCEADADGFEVGELYRTFAKRLERVVRSDVQAPASVIEDACQFAWARLVHHRGRVRRETVFGWLARTAMHEAFKLTRRGCREVSLDAEIEAGRDTPDPRPGPLDLYERRERLSTVSSLSARQQRVLWLYGVGLTYAEIADLDGCSSRTVERQLHRARARVRAADRGGDGCEVDTASEASGGRRQAGARGPR